MLTYINNRAANGKSRKGQIKSIIANDVANFHAPSTSSVFLELCQEDRRPEDERMRGELSVSMYGTRSPARNSQTCYTDVPCNCGFRVARGNTCILGHQERDNVVMVRGDDLVSTADIEDLRWLESMLKEKFKITTDIIGSNSGC